MIADIHSWYLAFQHAEPGSRNDLIVWNCHHCQASRTFFRFQGKEVLRDHNIDGKSCEDKLVEGVMTE